MTGAGQSDSMQVQEWNLFIVFVVWLKTAEHEQQKEALTWETEVRRKKEKNGLVQRNTQNKERNIKARKRYRIHIRIPEQTQGLC